MGKWRKAGILGALAVQNALLVELIAAYQRQADRKVLPAPVMVCWVEVAKLAACLVLEVLSAGLGNTALRMREDAREWRSIVHLAIPAGLYAVQNNLCYVALRALSPLVYHILYQSKVLTTALFSVALLGKRLDRRHWLALSLLTAGIALVQWASSKLREFNAHQAPTSIMMGLLALGTAAMTSGFAGVFFERMLKQGSPGGRPKRSLWLQSVYLGVFALPLSLVLARGSVRGDCLPDWPALRLIMLQAMSGLLVAVTIRHLDNILKTFATGASIVLSSMRHPDRCWQHPQFVLGTFMVLAAILLYGQAEQYKPPPPIDSSSQKHRKRRLRRIESNRPDD